MLQFRRIVAAALIVSIASLALPQPGYAGMLATGTAIAASDRDRITNVVNRAEFRAQLEAYGVNVKDVNARLAALTDEEIAQLARQVDSLPAGGDAAGAILGLAILVFVILVITDLLGVTHVFPFIKPIR
jgi:hypothetical protein